MKNFPKPQDTMAGIEKIWFIPVDDIAYLGDVILNQLQNITFASGKEWLSLYGTFSTKEFTEQKKETKNGIRFERSLQLFYPGYSQAILSQLEEMKVNRFLVAYKDNNGVYKIAGTLENPLNFTYKLSTGKSGSDAQGIEMEFYSNAFTRVLSATGETIGLIQVVYDDWFLPSRDELNAMYTNLHLEGVGGFSGDFYWASTETDSSSAWTLRFSDGLFAGTRTKINRDSVRACRSFTAEAGAYSLRDVGPAGGLIFYIDGTTYYEAAPSDQGNNEQYSNIISEIGISAQGTAIGAGQANTAAIIAQSGGAADWFLPSKDELAAIYTNLKAEGIGGFLNGSYISSSEYDSDQVYGQNFADGIINQPGKASERYIRPCRDFFASTGEYSLGDVGPTGGYVFYVDGGSYMEAAPEDLPAHEWSNVHDVLIGTTSPDIGQGIYNNAKIKNQPGHTDSAAKQCSLYDNRFAHTDSAAKLCDDLEIEN